MLVLPSIVTMPFACCMLIVGTRFPAEPSGIRPKGSAVASSLEELRSVFPPPRVPNAGTGPLLMMDHLAQASRKQIAENLPVLFLGRARRNVGRGVDELPIEKGRPGKLIGADPKSGLDQLRKAAVLADEVGRIGTVKEASLAEEAHRHQAHNELHFTSFSEIA